VRDFIIKKWVSFIKYISASVDIMIIPHSVNAVNHIC
jgi:hypothetical protein